METVALKLLPNDRPVALKMVSQFFDFWTNKTKNDNVLDETDENCCPETVVEWDENGNVNENGNMNGRN